MTKIVAMSDTHGFHSGLTVPYGDILIHSGDWSQGHGNKYDTLRFIKWFRDLPHKYKILVPGNHDGNHFGYQSPDMNTIKDLSISELKKQNIFVLDKSISSSILEIDGLRIGGCSYIPLINGGLNYYHEADITTRKYYWKLFPKVDILITHSPPKNILDMTRYGINFGCEFLRKAVLESIKPKIHFFGHVHESRGQTEINGIRFVNSCICSRMDFERDKENNQTKMSMFIREPMEIEL